MANVTIWHNPRCSKSRNAVTLLEEKGIEADVVKYLDTPPTKEELVAVLKMLGLPARELMRTKDVITSYSIHYTKLYEILAEISNSGSRSWFLNA